MGLPIFLQPFGFFEADLNHRSVFGRGEICRFHESFVKVSQRSEMLEIGCLAKAEVMGLDAESSFVDFLCARLGAGHQSQQPEGRATGVALDVVTGGEAELTRCPCLCLCGNLQQDGQQAEYPFYAHFSRNSIGVYCF